MALSKKQGLSGMRRFLLRLAALGLAAAPLFSAQAQARADDRCVQVFYDRSPDQTYFQGRTSATFLVNLLGHFPAFKTVAAPIEQYKAGQIERCRASFYIGTYYNNAIPPAFIDDFVATRRRVAWLGYSLWRIEPARLASALGVKFLRLTQLDNDKRDSAGRPTFYRRIAYKGETFEKYGEFKSGTDTFLSSHEMAAVEIASPETQVLATASHDGNGTQLPYAIRHGNRFFIADVPFSHAHESDRYLVFADLLFDILDAPPKHKTRLAAFRIEDVSSGTDPESVLAIARIAERLKISPQISLIPIFADPFGVLGRNVTKGVPIKDDAKFKATLAQLSRLGAGIVWHGVTHQFEETKNPRGASGFDFEFWDSNANAPVPGDSAKFVLDRLDRGWAALGNAGLKPVVWEVPHYTASPTDYLVFARVFAWNIGRIRYQAFEARNLPAAPARSLWYETAGLGGSKARLKAFERLTVTTSGPADSQFFPYEIYRDVYGQSVLPENLSYLDYAGSAPGVDPVDVMLARAKRNLVIRDAWASFYFHPFLIKRPGAEADLERLLKGLQAMGYSFVNLEQYVRAHRQGRDRVAQR